MKQPHIVYADRSLSVSHTDCQRRSESLPIDTDSLDLGRDEIERRRQIADSLTSELIDGAEIDWESDIVGAPSFCEKLFTKN
jgi:hypothetical protein